jgi:hypothetical protein
MLVYALAGPNGNIVLLEAGFVLTGAGLAFNTGPAVGLAMSAMPLTRAGLASGVANLARLVGITVGVAALGTVMALDGVRPALLAGAVVELMGAAVVLRCVSSKPRVAPMRPVRSLREGTKAARLRSARTCYDHFAGRLGVELMTSLLRQKVLTGGDGRYDSTRDTGDALSGPGHDVHYELTVPGRKFLADLTIEIPSGTRPLIRYCVDWTEQRHHLSGALGRAILDRFVDTDWVKRMPRGRAVKVTPGGRTALADWFGVDWTD